MHLNILPNTWLTKKLGDIFSLSAGGDVDKSLFSEKQDEENRGSEACYATCVFA